MVKEFEFKTGYVLGIVSIVLAFVNPIGGIVSGIIGITLTNKNSEDLAKKGKKFNKVGIILSIIFFILMVVSQAYLHYKGIGNLQNFPIK